MAVEYRVLRVGVFGTCDPSDPTKVSATSFTGPDQGGTNEYVGPYQVTGHVDGYSGKYYVGVGVGYHNGPADHVIMKTRDTGQEFVIRKGTGLFFYYPSGVNVCSNISHPSVDIKFPVPGQYEIHGFGGYTTGQPEVCVTSVIRKNVSISGGQPPSPSPSPAPPSPGSIPLWIWIILGVIGLISLISLIIAVIILARR